MAGSYLILLIIAEVGQEIGHALDLVKDGKSMSLKLQTLGCFFLQTQEVTLLTPSPEQEINEVNQNLSVSSFSMLETDHQEQETLLQSPLKHFISLVEP